MPGKLPIRAFLDELSDAIANPSPSRPMREAVGRQGRKVCDAVSVVPPWLRELPGLQRDLLFSTCVPYWDAGGISPPSGQLPFSGGQCPGEPYQITYTYTTGPCDNPTGNVNGPFTFNATGPITRDRTETPISGTVKTVRLFINGIQVQQFNLGLNCTVNPFALTGGDWGQFTVVRLNGPDNCGDPPVDIQPGPNPAPDPPDIPPDERPFNDPESGPILPIPDIPSAPGFPSVPWRNPFGAGEPSPGIPGDPGAPGDPVDTTGPGDVAEGEAEPGSELVALKLNLVSIPPFSQPLQNDVFRSVAFVYMGTVAGLDQDAAGALVRDGQLVYAERPGLTRWRVAANVGFTVRVTPFYQEVN